MISPAGSKSARGLLRELEAAIGDRALTLTVTLASDQRVEFGRGSVARLPAVLAALGAGGAGIVAGRSQARAGTLDGLSRALGGSTRTFTDVRPHAPADLCERALRQLDGCGVVVALGGGSALGIAKAVVCRLEVPLVAVPTTYAGSELTMLYGVTEHGVKRVRSDRRALPAAIVYDPELTDGLPERVAGASLFNCLAHCIECVVGGDDSLRALGALGGRLAADGLRPTRSEATAREGRDRLMLAGLCGGAALAEGRTGVHHAICHAIGGRTGASHGDINAVVLPAVVDGGDDGLRATAAEVTAPLRELPAAPPSGSDADVLRALRDGWGLPRRLRELGVAAADAEEIAQQVLDEDGVQPWSRAWDRGRLTNIIGGIT